MTRKLLNALVLIIFLKFSTVESAQECVDKSFSRSFVCCITSRTDLINAFGSVKIQLNCNTSKCTVSTGRTPEDVDKILPVWIRIYNKILEVFTVRTTKHDEAHQVLYFSPYVNACIKVDAPKNVVVKMQKRIRLLDMTCVVMLLAGLALFFSAEKLSSSAKFYYTGGVGLGVLASLLIVVFILSRFVPKKPAAYSILLGGWSVCCWILRKIWNNWSEFALEYQMIFFAYVGLTAFVSFSLCYWKGPIQDARTQHIIQWSIQILALILLYNSSQATIVSCSLVLCSVLVQFLYLNPSSDVFKRFRNIYRKLWKTKPKPRRLLTEEEYRVQGEVETKRALEELRKYCDSPNCSPWKTVTRIKSPTKFARFVSGESHVSDAEMTLHNEELTDSDSAENSDLISDDDTEDSVHLPANLKLNDFNINQHISDDED